MMQEDIYTCRSFLANTAKWPQKIAEWRFCGVKKGAEFLW